MRRFTAIVIVLLILAAGCTVAPPVATPVSPAATPVPGSPAPTSAPQPAAGEVAVAQPPVDGVGSEPKPGAGAEKTAGAVSGAVKETVVPPANDKTAPVVTLTIDPPELAWDDQATVTVRASDPAGIKEIDVLLGDQLLGTGNGEELELNFIPGAIDGLKGDSTYTLVAHATDLAGNEGQAQAQIKVGPVVENTGPAPTSAPTVATAAATKQPAAGQGAKAAAATATPAPRGAAVTADRGTTSYRVTEVQIPTYPYQPYLSSTTDPDRADYPVYTFDRSAYSAANPQPQMKSYRLLVLENRYLRIGILPDLGGRIYEVVFKPTGSNEFYANTVVKPTEWGPASPPGANWWLGTGGLEWGFPVEEHGYEFGTVWGFDHATLDDGSIMITVYTTSGPEKPYVNVDIILPPDTAYFVVQPRVVNPLGGPFKFKFWENAMLAPGKANSVSPDLRLYFPAQQVTVHSTGDPSLPQAGQAASWPMMGGKDLSRLGNWQNYLGVFATPPTANYAGVYDPGADEGIVRVFPSDVAKGVKLFAPRGANGLDPALWTDDGSSYVELHGGLTPTFADWYELGPSDEVTWSEFWYPVAKIGGLTFANDRAALSLGPSPATPGNVRLGLFPTTAITGTLTVTLPGAAPATFDVQLSPDQPLVRDLPLSGTAGQQGQAAVTLVVDGETVFDWSGVAQLR